MLAAHGQIEIEKKYSQIVSDVRIQLPCPKPIEFVKKKKLIDCPSPRLQHFHTHGTLLRDAMQSICTQRTHLTTNLPYSILSVMVLFRLCAICPMQLLCW